jgi:hypothetical protein
MELLNYLGEVISNNINISAPAARGLLRLAIKDSLGPFMKLNEISYDQFRNVIENSLKKRLIDLNVANHKELIAILSMELIKNQSLLTLEKV